MKSADDTFKVARVALQFLAKYRETGLLLLRASAGLLLILFCAPVLLEGERAWTHFGSAMKAFGFRSNMEWWGFFGALAGSVGGVLMTLGLFFRIGVLLALSVVIVHAVIVSKTVSDFHRALPAIEMAILLVSLLFVGPGKYSIDKN